MPGKNIRTEDGLWLLGSLCSLYRIPFDAALVASQFPPPHTRATFHAAARALGFKPGTHPLPRDGWAKLPFPCIAFLKGARSTSSASPSATASATPGSAAAST